MTFPRRSDVRAQASVLGVCLALTCAINLSTRGPIDRAGQLKGTDFLHFYSLGSVALDGPPAALYDHRALAERAAALVPESRAFFYFPIYGPQLSLFFAPLATLPYAWALVAWVSISAALYAACCAAIWRICPALHAEASTVALLAAASPAFFNLLVHGQNSAIALACLTAAFFALKHQKRFLAGLAIGMLIYKPTLGLAAACVFALTLEWRVVLGAIAGAAVQLGGAWLYYGTDVMRAYWRAVRGVPAIRPLLDIKPFQMHSLLSFWQSLVPWPNIALVLYIVSAAVIILIACRVWIARAPLSLRYSVLLLATVLVSPHLNVYDLVILAPALLMIGDWTLAHAEDPLAKPMQRMLYFSYVLPLFGILAKFCHVQFSVIAMSALTGTIALAALRRPSVQIDEAAC